MVEVNKLPLVSIVSVGRCSMDSTIVFEDPRCAIASPSGFHVLED